MMTSKNPQQIDKREMGQVLTSKTLPRHLPLVLSDNGGEGASKVLPLQKEGGGAGKFYF